jgi:hypothetical protein
MTTNSRRLIPIFGLVIVLCFVGVRRANSNEFERMEDCGEVAGLVVSVGLTMEYCAIAFPHLAPLFHRTADEYDSRNHDDFQAVLDTISKANPDVTIDKIICNCSTRVLGPG